MSEGFLEQLAQYGPLVAVAIAVSYMAIQKIYQYASKTKFTNDDSTDVDVEIAEINTALEYQSEQMEKIEKQTTNHLSDIQENIGDMKEKRQSLDKKIAKIEQCIEEINKKLD